MPRKPRWSATVQLGRGGAGIDSDAGAGGPEPRRLGKLRRPRDVPPRVSSVDACPSCGLPIRDRVAARLGFCDRCREFTGMCGAGRKIICPDMMSRTTWHTPCTELGAVAWEINLGQRRSRTMLCRVHDAQVRFGGMPWIVDAAPLEEVRTRRPPQPVTK
jgi:hypothetical protein